MTLSLSLSWNDNKPTRPFLAALLVLALALPVGAAVPRRVGPFVDVIVRAMPTETVAVVSEVEAAGGQVSSTIGLIDGVVARVPQSAMPQLAASPHVASVTPNGRIRLLSLVDGYAAASDPGSMMNTTRIVGARDFWSSGYTGKGIDVALIDSGVVPVDGLRTPDKVVNGVDLSFEAGADNLRYLDSYGHGTHLAGIIAGRDDSVSSTSKLNWGLADERFVGIAPDARIVNVKVAEQSGATDVSQVIAGIDWVVQHRNDAGLNVRVINLSFGTDGVQEYVFDPLAYAAEVAWRKGLVVVVAAGNSGYGTAKLNNPAYDPYVLAVGASRTNGTVTVADDEIPTWSSRGDGLRNPDLVAPGRSIVSLRVPGSLIDTLHPEGRVNAGLFRGSGTSQAAAVVSGMTALLLQARPTMTPNQVKAFFTRHAKRLLSADAIAQGSGMAYIDKNDLWTATQPAAQTWPTSSGLGSLELSRGSAHVELEGIPLVGETTVFGALDPSWAGNSWSGNSWSGGSWSGNSWSGNSWSGGQWNGSSWSGNSWSGTSWSGNSWSGNSWSGNSWSGNSWSGNSWSAAGWQ